MKSMPWQELNPRRGQIRRAVRAVVKMNQVDAISAVCVVCLLAAMIFSIAIIMGERPSGPAAALSSLHQGFLKPFSSFSTGHDPRAHATVSRADHGHLAGEVVR